MVLFWISIALSIRFAVCENCGTFFARNGGYIMSRNFPGNYPNNERCTYTIRADVGKRIVVQFIDFTTENGYDKVTFTSGITSPSLSGTAIPSMKESISNVVTFDFTSDGSVSRRGWKLKYRQFSVQANWSEWSEWESCSRTCGHGHQIRRRTCTMPALQAGSEYCKGQMYDHRSCETRQCPVDGEWSNWAYWGLCSKSCGDGQQVRTRNCTNPPPSYGGQSCRGTYQEFRNCSTTTCPVNGQWSEWGDFTECSAPCGGGTKTRLRRCDNPTPIHGGEYCNGTSYVTIICNNFSCSVGGEWSDWTTWSTCSMTCNGGQQNRKRFCNNPLPAHGSQNCSGISNQTRSCGDNRCRINGHWSDWRNWTLCTRSCGGGERTRTRQCNNPEPLFGGSFCEGKSFQHQLCNNVSCPVDGRWSDWSNWSHCSKSCDGGFQNRTRTCSDPFPTKSGQNCSGESVETRPCNPFSCPVNGGWSAWEKWTFCSATCGGGLKARSRICNSPMPRDGGRYCFGEPLQMGHCNNFSCPINGHWSDWSNWSTCNQSCGVGRRNRSRTCTNPPPAHGGSNCSESSIQYEACNVFECPVDGAWSPWSAWAPCSRSCGNGSQIQKRECKNPAPQQGGKYCANSSYAIRRCNLDPCPIHGDWTIWSVWSLCSRSCGGGHHNRSRSCTSPTPEFGGRNCSGESYQLEICNNDSCPVNGNWSSWGNWSRCTKPCGGGHQSRTRICSSPPPAYGGNYCQGNSFELRNCSVQNCPVHGGWSLWTDWSECPATCGDAVRIRTRKCNSPLPSFGGLGCSGNNTETLLCNESSNCLRDGQWTHWSNWSICSKSCGGGQQVRLRSCDNPKPSFGGQYCEGKEFEERICNREECLVDGIWSSWSNWGICSNSCGGGKKLRVRRCNNPSPAHGGRNCSGAKRETRNCNTPDCPVDGSWSVWHSWSTCSRSCGVGQQVRSRMCNNPQPISGGQFCLGTSFELRECNVTSCPLNGFWSPWSVWNECSQTCGGGHQQRSRVCNNPLPLFGGEKCSGFETERRLCNGYFCPVDGNWTKWSRWEPCSFSQSNYFQSRFRSCSNPVPAFGGSMCSGNSTEILACNASNNETPCERWSAWRVSHTCSKDCLYRRQRVCERCRNTHGNTCKLTETQSQLCSPKLYNCKPEELESLDKEKTKVGKTGADKQIAGSSSRLPYLLIPVGVVVLIAIVAIVVAVIVYRHRRQALQFNHNGNSRDTIPMSEQTEVLGFKE